MQIEMDPKGLEAAVEAVADSEGWNEDDMPITRQTAEAAIRAYLSATTPPAPEAVAGLVGRAQKQIARLYDECDLALANEVAEPLTAVLDALSQAHARIEALEGPAAELISAIDKRWAGETARKRENAISPRMEEAIEALRAALAQSKGGLTG